LRIRDIKRESRASLKNKWGFAILLSIIVFAIYAIIPLMIEILFSGGYTTWSNQDSVPVTAQFVSWIFTIALYPIIYGSYATFLDMVRSEPVGLKNIFQGFEETKYFKIIGAYLLTVIYTLLWFFVFIIPAFIKSISYSQVYFVLKDNPELSPRAAITMSRQLMNGYKWKYFLLMLSFIGWSILSILTLFIGLLWLVPYINASLAAFYNSLVKSGEVKEVL
jgi:uncharacterized membrane protein